MFQLITGGSGSGKSAFAESMICRYHQEAIKREPGLKLYYAATMIPYGEETRKKIQRHREMRRDKGFETIECYTDVAALPLREAFVGKQHCILLECMSNLAANEMYEPEGAGKNTVSQILKGIQKLRDSCSILVVVTNEICSESAVDTVEMQEYRRVLSNVNLKLAREADIVTEVVYGIPVCIKGEQRMVQEKKTDETSNKTAIKMVVGGACQGKRAFAETQYGKVSWADGRKCREEDLYTCRGIHHFEVYIRRRMEEGQDVEGLPGRIVRENPDVIIVSGEIGLGLVPVDAFEREYREQTGRICTELAALASRVHRVVCGIGILLKGKEKP